MGAWKDNCWQLLSKQLHHLRIKCLLICLFLGKGRRHMLSSQKGVAPVWTSMWVRCRLCCPEPCVQADRVEDMSTLQRLDRFPPMRLETNATGQLGMCNLSNLGMCNLSFLTIIRQKGLSFLTIRQKVWGTPIIIRQLLWHMLLIAWWWWWPCLWLGRGANNGRSMWHRCGRCWWSRCGRCWTRCRCCNRLDRWHRGNTWCSRCCNTWSRCPGHSDTCRCGAWWLSRCARCCHTGCGCSRHRRHRCGRCCHNGCIRHRRGRCCDTGCTRLIRHIGCRQDRCRCWQWWRMHMTVLSVGCGLSCKYTMQITIISSCTTTSLPSLDIHPCWILKAKSNTEKKKYIHLQQFQQHQQHQPQAATTTTTTT